MARRIGVGWRRAMIAGIRAIEYYLPERRLTNHELAAQFPEWSVEKIEAKTGIRSRAIASAEECSSDLAVGAARKLFASGACRPEDIGFVLLCTQSPDYFLPTTACLVQHRLGIPASAGALDFNLGCSGFVYGLGLAKGLVETGQAGHVLLITAETYSKFIHPLDRSVRTLFGDAAAATLVGPSELPARSPERIGPFVFGTDGSGADNLIVPAGGLRRRAAGPSDPSRPGPEHLYMNGPEIFTFTLRAVPAVVGELLRKADRKLDDIDAFIFHQANRHMLEHLRKRLHIPESRFPVCLEDCGNTVSSTIPIALKQCVERNQLRPGMTAMLVGFGVGYSWGATLIEW